MNTHEFQLSLPCSFRQYSFVIGDPSTFRTVLTDPLTTKPSEIYGRMKNMNATRTAAIFTSNGSIWHSKRKAGKLVVCNSISCASGAQINFKPLVFPLVAPAFSSVHIKRMNTLAIEKCESWIQEKLLVANGEEGARFNVATEMIDIVLSAICETAFDYKMPKWERDYLGEELEYALVCFFSSCIIFVATP